MSAGPSSDLESVDEAEVVVVGAGPAGSVAAATLAELGRDVLMVDQSEFPREKPCGDGLTHPAIGVIEDLGLGSIATEAQPIEDCRIVIGHRAEMKGWYRPPADLPESRLMRTMPRTELDLALLEAALERGARLTRARADGAVLERDEVRGVQVGSGEYARRIDAACVIGADGATSRMRRAAGIGGELPGTQVYALRQYFTTAEPLAPVFDVYVPLVYEGGLLAGYGWVFPVAERRANVGVAYYTPPAGRARARIRQVLEGFVDELSDREGERFGALTDPSPPVGAPIAVRFSPQHCQHGNLLLAGEAAMAADPLTGEGISFAMRSGRIAAQAADRLLRTGEAPDLGRALGRAFPRLGQDLSLFSRVAAGAGDGFKLMDREHQPFVLAVRRVTGGAPDEPGVDSTEVRALLAEDGELAGALDLVNESLLDALRTSFPFGLEVLHRETRAHGGPVAAACALLVARARGGELDRAALDAAVAAEQVALIDRCLPRLAPRVDSDLAWLNNAMALLLGDLALTAALSAPNERQARFAREIGAAIRRISEGEAIELEDRFDADRSLERCRESTDARSGTLYSLAATLGAVAAGADDELDRLAAFGRHLGIALQVSEDVRELTLGDALTRRRPGSELREGSYSLPVLFARDADPELTEALGDHLPGRVAGTIVARIRDSGAVEDAEAECRSHVEWALEAIADVPGRPGELLRSLAAFPATRLPRTAGQQVGMTVAT